MWTRSELKQRAKDQMKGRYFNYLGASLMPQIASYIISIPLSIVTQIVMIPSFFSVGMLMENPAFLDQLYNNIPSTGITDFDMVLSIILATFSAMTALIIPMIIVSLVSLASTLLVINPVMVGVYRWNIRSREDRNISFSMCFSAFRKNSYIRTVLAIAYQMLFLFLWSLLLWIPAIIKGYAYRMIPYIIADNPHIGAKRALKLSCMMTRGHKFEIFILDLSFIGWYLLGLIACCIGVYAVVPYQNATNAELYDVLKREAIEKSYTTMEELGYIKLVPPAAIEPTM